MDLECYSPETIRGAAGCLKALITRKADLNDSESVKLALATEEKKEKHWSQNRRRNVINAYTLFLQFQGKTWIKPKCTVDEKFPFIPTEAEIDALIIGSHKKLAAFLQLLKETAIRSGEAHQIQWTDIDAQQKIITINKPEKHSNARMFKVSTKLIEMLNNMPKTCTHVFNCYKKGTQVTLQKTRKRLAGKLGNPRLLKIHLHTFRHWKATMLYHELKDAHYIQHFLGHKSIKSTEKYFNIEHTIFQTPAPDQKWIVKVTADPQQIAQLIANGFEAHCNQGDLIFLRKRP
jgi:integrase